MNLTTLFVFKMMGMVSLGALIWGLIFPLTCYIAHCFLWGGVIEKRKVREIIRQEMCQVSEEIFKDDNGELPDEIYIRTISIVDALRHVAQQL